MEQQKLNFITHEVNDIIGEVPKQVLRVCLALLFTIVISVAIMSWIIPYPANVPVAAKQFYYDKEPVSAGNPPGKHPVKLHCKLILKDNQFNRSYLARFSGASIIVRLGDKKYMLHYSSFVSIKKDSFLIADIALKNDQMLQLFYLDKNRTDTTDQSVELVNENFTVKDRLCASLHTLLTKED